MTGTKDKRSRIEIRCRKCNQHMFDYLAGSVELEIKCCRCKRVMALRGMTEAMIRSQAVGDVWKI